MLPRVVLLLALGVLVAGCGDDGDATGGDGVLLSESSFAEVVASELRKDDLEAARQGPLGVHVEDGLNRVDLRLGEAFREYEREPERRDAIVAEVVQEVARRLEEGIGSLSFAQAEDSLMPLLKPRFALRALAEEPAQTRLPASLSVIYAVERESDFIVVTPEDVERWGRPLARIHAAALANLLRQTNEEEKLLCEPSGGSELCGWASGDGYDATRMIVPGLRRQIEQVYDGPAVYAVPTESVFVALPYRIATRKNTETLLRARVQRDFSSADDPVSPELFVERRGKLVVFGA